MNDQVSGSAALAWMLEGRVRQWPNTNRMAVFDDFLNLAHAWDVQGWLKNQSYYAHLRQCTAVEVGVRAREEAEEASRRRARESELNGEHSDIDEEAIDSDATEPSSSRKRMRRKKEPKMRRFLPDPIPGPPEGTTKYGLAIALMKEGLKNVTIDNTRLSDFAYLEPIPEMEDEVPDRARGPVTLLPHQREAVGRWIHTTEKYGCFLLADDMGLGKTLVAIAYIKQRLVQAKKDGVAIQFLICASKSLLSTWTDEFTICPSIKLLVYHTGVEREYSKTRLETYDVILTTYDLIKNEYMRVKNVQSDFKDVQDGYRFLRERVEAQNFKFSKVQQDGWKMATQRAEAPLLAIHFEEVILDEAHSIKTRDVKKSLAVCQLKSKTRVAISGTPMQNSYWDLFSLFRFMRLAPFNDLAFFKLCFYQKDNRHSDYAHRLNTDCELILAAVLRAISLRRVRDDSFQGKAFTQTERPVHMRYLTSLTEVVQRTQDETESIWNPIRSKEVKKERERATRAARIAKVKLTKTSEREIFTQLFEARVNAIHSLLIDAKYGEVDGEIELDGFRDRRRDVLEFESADSTLPREEELRGISARQQALAKDEKAKKQWAENRKAFRDEIAQQENGWWSDKNILVVETIGNILDEVNVECESMTDEAERKEFRARNKIIVFSEFLAELDILKIGIQKELGRDVRRLDGRKTTEERDMVRKLFEEEGKDFTRPDHHPDKCPILLATIKSCGEGLNLVHGRHIILVSPMWNPYAGEQAISRAVRITSRLQPIIYRFVTERSMEVYMADVGMSKRARVEGIEDTAKLIKNKRRMLGWSDEYAMRLMSKGQASQHELRPEHESSSESAPDTDLDSNAPGHEEPTSAPAPRTAHSDNRARVDVQPRTAIQLHYPDGGQVVSDSRSKDEVKIKKEEVEDTGGDRLPWKFRNSAGAATSKEDAIDLISDDEDEPQRFQLRPDAAEEERRRKRAEKERRQREAEEERREKHRERLNNAGRPQ